MTTARPVPSSPSSLTAKHGLPRASLEPFSPRQPDRQRTGVSARPCPSQPSPAGFPAAGPSHPQAPGQPPAASLTSPPAALLTLSTPQWSWNIPGRSHKETSLAVSSTWNVLLSDTSRLLASFPSCALLRDAIFTSALNPQLLLCFFSFALLTICIYLPCTFVYVS